MLPTLTQRPGQVKVTMNLEDGQTCADAMRAFSDADIFDVQVYVFDRDGRHDGKQSIHIRLTSPFDTLRMVGSCPHAAKFELNIIGRDNRMRRGWNFLGCSDQDNVERLLGKTQGGSNEAHGSETLDGSNEVMGNDILSISDETRVKADDGGFESPDLYSIPAFGQGENTKNNRA
ncbi:hypothetical protein PFICI_13542 [Pestalotiopsis fici W106-1]|uniref:Uncharacterized protein n=1 Tax=Pestalotiopsis fici (strain W106-1 / CGMCC3.15140) TaxID=1229662 RepID=W3WMG0_PESFW|nr:uncharacterized protein PFICI_13542 [Pestalotiopsis fici W106-1]ETS75058.1 hypothetical protein PFICI_13542 [Pestalotiopsis fici W106-1]